MSSEDIPQNVSQFIVDHINSVEQLETLLLLHAEPAREWTAEQIAKELRTSTDAARLRLTELKRIPCVEEISSAPPKYRFATSNAALCPIVDAVARQYKDRRVSIISLIYTKPANELRAFSDAFRIKKKEDT